MKLLVNKTFIFKSEALYYGKNIVLNMQEV